MLEEEMNFFSIITLFVSIVIAALVAFWPSDQTFSMFNIMRTLVLLIMAGIIQYMMFRMYIHQGREHRYQVEKELLGMNEQLLRRQIELMKEAEGGGVGVSSIRKVVSYYNGETDFFVDDGMFVVRILINIP